MTVAHSQQIRVAAPAKINFFLAITGKRDDGYHLMDSLIVFLNVFDHITVEANGTGCISVSGPFADAVPGDASNIVWRAAAVLAEDMPGVAETIGTKTIDIHIEKNIPVGAGLGGGSTDAAAVMRALCRLWSCDLDETALRRAGLRVGADVPACLAACPVYVGGIGDELTSARVPAFDILVVFPERHVSTAAVYRAFDAMGADSPAVPAGLEDAPPAVRAIAARNNDLQQAAISLVPEIETCLAALAACEGCLLARMSGSGSACFGIFEDAATASRAAAEIAGAHPGWWIRAAQTGAGDRAA